MELILVVNLDLPVVRRQAFEKTVQAALSASKYVPGMFYYDLESLRKKIVCLCKKGCLHNATIFHYGTSNDAVKVAKIRTYKCGSYQPVLLTTASSDLLEDLNVKFSKSGISGKELKNSNLVKFVENTENYVYYDAPADPGDPAGYGFDKYYSNNLQAEYTLSNKFDVIYTKEKPNLDDSRVFSQSYEIRAINTEWSYSDFAVSEFHKNNMGNPFSGTIDDNDIVTIKAGEISIKTPLACAEAAGVVNKISKSNDSNRIIEVAQNQEDIWTNYTKQLLQHAIPPRL